MQLHEEYEHDWPTTVGWITDLSRLAGDARWFGGGRQFDRRAKC